MHWFAASLNMYSLGSPVELLKLNLSQINSFKLLVDSFFQLPGNRLAKQSREKKSDWLKGGGRRGWWMPGMYVWTWARVLFPLARVHWVWITKLTRQRAKPLLCLFGLFLVSYRVFLYFDLICEECYFVAQCKKEKHNDWQLSEKNQLIVGAAVNVQRCQVLGWMFSSQTVYWTETT